MKQGAIIVEFSDFKVCLPLQLHLDAETSILELVQQLHFLLPQSIHSSTLPVLKTLPLAIMALYHH
jgi:hypothetical protein